MRAEEVIRKIRDDGVEIRVLKTFVQSERPRAISGVVPTGPGSGGRREQQTQDPQSRPGAPSAHLRSSAPVFFSRLKNVPLGLLELSLFF